MDQIVQSHGALRGNGQASAIGRGGVGLGKAIRPYLTVLTVLALPWPVAAQFVAYNDLSGPGSGSSAGNVTNLSLGNSGQLINYDTGAGTGVNLQVTGFDNAHRDDSFSVPNYTSGDAAVEFGTILNNGYIRHNTVGQGYVEMLFTGLDPSKRYTVVITGERGEPSYTNRNTKFTLSGVDSFVNSSSAGIPYSGSNWVEFNTGHNTVNGFVARFSDVNPGANGSMLVTAGVGTNSASGHWYVNTLKLVESGPVDAVVFEPAHIDAVVGSADVDVTLSIPAGSNASGDVQVTLESDQPGVAAPAGVCCSPVVVTFPQGGPTEQTVAIDIGHAGGASITTTNDADLTDTALTVTVTAGEAAFVPISLFASAFSTVPVTVAITPGSNDTRDVEVTVSSDHPAVAVPQGAVGGSLVLTFAAGAPAEQMIQVDTGSAGSTSLRTTNDGGLDDAVLPVVVTGSGGGFIAYNDVVYSGGSGHPALTSNVTTFNIGNGSPGPSGGELVDKATGAPTGVTATLAQSGGVNWQPSASTGGSDCNPGTDARNVFDPDTTVSLMGTVYYGSAGWWVDVTFTGLDPARKYEFVTTANRDEPSYGARVTRYTLSGADAFVNASTPGTTITGGGASTSFVTGNNTAAGYVARWIEIEPGADGSFKVRAEAGTSEHRAYAFDAFMLAESALIDSVHVSPGHIDAVVGSADVDVTLSIPPDSNVASAVKVTLTSDDPSVAEAQGAAGSPFDVVFPMGGPTQQLVPIAIGAAGNAAISTTNDADLTDTLLTVTVTAGEVAFIPATLLASTDTTVPLTVGISPGSNDTRAVNVTVSSDDPAIAVPEGAVGDSIVLTFAAGAPSEQVLNVEIGEEGTTALRTTNDGGLGDAVLPVEVIDLSWIRVVVDPYADVDWTTFERHKANMHTHTTESDGNLTPAQTIDEYHARGYSILAITDHNRNTWPWQAFGRDPEALGMLAVSGNEPSDHHHVNSFFIQFTTNSTNLELTLTQIGDAGGLTTINHPGRYNLSVQDYVTLFDTFDHAFALEVINQAGRYNGNWSPVWPGNDLHLWDLILSIVMPDRPVWGTATDDMHNIGHLGRDWLMYLVPEGGEPTMAEQTGRAWANSFLSTGPDEAVIRDATVRGQYYFSSVGTHPSASRDVNQTPVIDSIVVDNDLGTITINATSGEQPLPANNYRWISMAAQVHVGPTINFRTTPGVENYVRAEMAGLGGTTYTNPFGIALVGPTIALSTNQINRSVHLGESLSNDSFTVANSGPDTLTYGIGSDVSWLTVLPDAGSSSGEANLIEVIYDVVDLPAGIHPATITVSSPQAVNSPQTIAVTVEIRTVGPDFDGDGDVDLADFGYLQACLGLPAAGAGCEDADLDGLGVFIDALDVEVLLGCLSGANLQAAPECDP